MLLEVSHYAPYRDISTHYYEVKIVKYTDKPKQSLLLWHHYYLIAFNFYCVLDISLNSLLPLQMLQHKFINS